jgi:hypothetical protein
MTEQEPPYYPPNMKRNQKLPQAAFDAAEKNIKEWGNAGRCSERDVLGHQQVLGGSTDDPHGSEDAVVPSYKFAYNF